MFLMIFIEALLICKVVLVSSVQQSDTVIYMCECVHMYTHIYILFCDGLSQDVDILCYAVGPCCLSILYMVIYINI